MVPTSTTTMIPDDFEIRLQHAWDRGIRSGEVVYSQSTSLFMDDAGIPFEARYLPCLDKKPTSRSPSPSQDSDSDAESVGESCSPMAKDPRPEARRESKAPTDPFAAPRDNVVAEMSEYTCVLNKYALEPGHFLIVTNDFYPQRGPLRKADLEIIYDAVGRNDDRYCFFNSGQLAGASQVHRHFQFLKLPSFKSHEDRGCSESESESVDAVTRASDRRASWPEQIYRNAPSSTTPQRHPLVPARHYLLPIHASSPDSLLASFETLHAIASTETRDARRAERESRIQKGDADADGEGDGKDSEMPYNFLMTKRYMVLLPRRNEEWDAHEIGVGGTCLIGTIMVSKQRDLKYVEKSGLREILGYVGFPRSADAGIGE